MIIEFKDFSFDNLYDKVNYKLTSDKIFAIIGSNGSGKSLLTYYIKGIYKNYTGDILINNSVLSDDNYEILCNDIFIIKQNPHLQLVGELVIDELLFFFENMKLSNNQIEDKIDNLELINNILFSKNKQISGGQAQLILIQEAIMSNAKCIIFDESFSSLNKENKELIFKILKKLDFLIIFITNNHDDLDYADEIIKLENCKLNKYKYVNSSNLKLIDIESKSLIKLDNVKTKRSELVYNIEFKEGINLITGDNGIGKSTIFEAIINFTKYSGTITSEIDITDIGYINQYPLIQVTRNTILEEVDIYDLNIEQLKTLMNNFKLSHNLLNQDVTVLSTGELTIILILINIILNKKLILLDESLEVIDIEKRIILLEIIKNKKINIIAITHNPMMYHKYANSKVEVKWK
ncbi:MAG: ATP-binding cassette domain-containing protein [Mycoplasmatales bacterium]